MVNVKLTDVKFGKWIPTDERKNSNDSLYSIKIPANFPLLENRSNPKKKLQLKEGICEYSEGFHNGKITHDYEFQNVLKEEKIKRFDLIKQYQSSNPKQDASLLLYDLDEMCRIAFADKYEAMQKKNL